jgi:hypothetical protein
LTVTERLDEDRVYAQFAFGLAAAADAVKGGT